MIIGKSKRSWLSLGILGSLVVGIFYPLTGMLSGMEIGNLGGTGTNAENFDKSIEYGWILIAFGVLSFSV